jgi:hypothetical protein
MNVAHAAATKNAKDEAAVSRNQKHAQAATELDLRTRQACSEEQRLVQRKASACACGGGCPRCLEAEGIQAKIKIGAPDDKYEREADKMADRVMRMSEPHIQRQSSDKQQVELQATPLNAPASGGKTDAKIDSLKGDGQTLPRSTRQFFESRMGYDFSDVRIYSGANAAEAAQSVNARAFTLGNRLVFNHGEYAPDSDAGKRLIAHELTHSLQQKRSSDRTLQRQPADDEDEMTRRGRRYASRQPPGAQREDVITSMRADRARSIAKVGTIQRGEFRTPDGRIQGIRLAQDFRANFHPEANPAHYAIVQWIRGEMYSTDAQGRHYFPANYSNALYGRSADQPWLFMNWIIDSPDADPRLQDAMNITVPVTNFQDVPGFESPQVLDNGFVWDVHARVGIYLWGGRVPTAVGNWESQRPTPLREVEWGWRIALNSDRRGYRLIPY